MPDLIRHPPSFSDSAGKKMDPGSKPGVTIQYLGSLR
jgi:hypothetical protein